MGTLMPGIGDSVDDAKDAASDNWKPGVGAGIVLPLSRGVGGPVLGPAIGGSLAAGFLGGDGGDYVARRGFEMAAAALVSGGGGGGAQSSGRRRM